MEEFGKQEESREMGVNAGCGEELLVFKSEGTEGFHVSLEPGDEAFHLGSGGVGSVAFQKPAIDLHVIGE
jgi:hypothetical protein